MLRVCDVFLWGNFSGARGDVKLAGLKVNHRGNQPQSQFSRDTKENKMRISSQHAEKPPESPGDGVVMSNQSTTPRPL
jgi:hypothetical protein